jgi:hypothetical protein
MQSFNGYLRILDIDRSSCRRVPLLICGSASLAAAGLGLSGLHWHLLAPALFLVLIIGLQELRSAWPGSARFVTSIRIWPDGRFVVRLGRAPQALLAVTLTHSWTIPGFALGLAFAGEDGLRCHAFLFRDQMPSDLWRLLRVRLRYAGG